MNSARQHRLPAARGIAGFGLLALAWVAVALLAAGCSGGGGSSILIPPLSRVVISLGGDTTVVADTLNVGIHLEFNATAYDLSGNPVSGLPFTWRSTNPLVFAVNRDGRVLGVGEGDALLIADISGVADTVELLVLPGTSGWVAQTSNWSSPLNDVFFDQDGRRGWAVGDGGAILATPDAGEHWTRQDSHTLFNLNAVWFTDAGNGWAVGNSGMAVHTVDSGVTWDPLPTGASENLRDVFFAYPDTGWAVGSAGAILRTVDSGATWQKQNPTTAALYAVAFAGTRLGWAVGDNGTIVGTVDRGVTWTIEPSLTSTPLRGVVRRSEFVAFAAGQQGVVPRTENVGGVPAWELQNTGASNQLEDVFYTSDFTGYVAGFNGTGIVLRTDDAGVNWTSQVMPVSTTLHAVFFVDGLRGWVVGDGGRILHTASGGE
jgi:photosystem II stability/assembly factor-like uncharacterized protein